MKIRPVGVELFHATGGLTDGRTDMTKLIVAFRNFANALKTGDLYQCFFQLPGPGINYTGPREVLEFVILGF